MGRKGQQPERHRGVHLEAVAVAQITPTQRKDGRMLPGSGIGNGEDEDKRKAPSGEYRLSPLLEWHPVKPTVDWKDVTNTLHTSTFQTSQRCRP